MENVNRPVKCPPNSNTSLHLDCELSAVVQEVKENFRRANSELKELKEICKQKELTEKSPPNDVAISLVDLKRLQRETRILKEMLPKVLNSELLNTYAQLNVAQQELEKSRQNEETLRSERDHWKSRCDITLADVDRERQGKFRVECELRESSQQLTAQSEYCASMGSAVCTLLWRVSRCEQSIQNILVGSKVDEFFSLVSVTVESYLHTYNEEAPPEQSDETQFILALCGTITNIAASPIGRNFLMKNESGRHLIDVFIETLSDAPIRKYARMKNLILMTLYNISINQQGLKHICDKAGIISLLVWQLQDECDTENRVHSLRLIGSLLCEQTSMKLVHEANEVLTVEMLQKLASDPCVDIRDVALQLMSDMHVLNAQYQQQVNEP